MLSKFQSGFISLVGRPNVGKSTLMNLLIGEKISIISSKPQTTRNRIRSILTHEHYQMVFIDTPGIHNAKSKLGSYMVKSAEASLREIDLALFLVEPRSKIPEGDRRIIQTLSQIGAPVFLVVNKIDIVEKSRLLGIIDEYQSLYSFAEIVPVSALKAENTELLLQTMLKYLPEGPKYFPGDMVTDQPERQIVAELIREKALQLLQDEIPHGIAVDIQSMKKRNDKELVDVEATIYCEKESHKGMIIGKQGTMLKKIGSRARADIESLLGSPINLQLWVKIKKDWRDNDFLLKSFGFDGKEI